MEWKIRRLSFTFNPALEAQLLTRWSEMKHYSSGRVKYTGLYKILKHSSFWSKLSTIVFIYNLSHCHSIHTQGSTMSFTVNSSWGCGIHWLYIKMDNTRAPQKGSWNFAIRAIAMILCWRVAVQVINLSSWFQIVHEFLSFQVALIKQMYVHVTSYEWQLSPASNCTGQLIWGKSIPRLCGLVAMAQLLIPNDVLCTRWQPPISSVF